MKLHALSGLPRAGTTLFGNVLAQHPDIHVSGTSALAPCIEQIQNALSAAPEVQSDLANVPGAYERYLAAFRGLCEGWYADRPEPIVVDKGRGWIMHRALLDQIASGSVLVVCVRDPRDVIASIERQHRASAAFNSPFGRTLPEMAAKLMHPEGNVGGPMRFCEHLIASNPPGVEWVRYETFVRDPATTLDRIAAALGITQTWDFENVESVATDLDALTYNKFPHDGTGPIKPNGLTWQDTLDPALAAVIASQYPRYMQTFAYGM